ncbi:hypothetical protein E2C01_006104 [Portunus trituberculatus]|uniref:Uncharacterized protein n=1 Tax=Portunus trituberculatus TaxID=210409 RepID=A0A5B7CVG4_PORTR|nr:hypothetical protein [Portunus trituberculatus]
MGEPGQGSVHLVTCEGQDVSTSTPAHLPAMQKTFYETYPAQPPSYTSYYDNAFNNGYSYDAGSCGQYYDEYVDYRAACGLASNMMPQHLMIGQGPQADYSYMSSPQMGYYESSFTRDYPAWARETSRGQGKKSPAPLSAASNLTPTSAQGTTLPTTQHSLQPPTQPSTQTSVQQASVQQPPLPQGQPPTVVTPPNQLTPISLPSGAVSVRLDNSPLPPTSSLPSRFPRFLFLLLFFLVPKGPSNTCSSGCRVIQWAAEDHHSALPPCHSSGQRTRLSGTPSPAQSSSDTPATSAIFYASLGGRGGERRERMEEG